MSEDEVYTSLTEIFREVFMRDDLILKPQFTAEDVAGWDSFKHVEILIAIHERLGVKFTTKEMDNLANVGDIARTIMSKRATARR